MMNFSDLKNLANSLYGPAFVLEDLFSHQTRKKIETVFQILLVLAVISSLLIYVLSFTGLKGLTFLPKLLSITSFLFVIWVILFMLEGFYYSYTHVSSEEASGKFVDFDLASVISKVGDDVTFDFFYSGIGGFLLVRCGIPPADFEKFLPGRKNVLKSVDFKIDSPDNYITLGQFVTSLVDSDKELSDFLSGYGIQKKDILGISLWITELDDSYSEKERWWSRNNLFRIPGLGQSLSYGKAYNLEKYERALSSGLSRFYKIHSSYGVKERKELEAVLSRNRGANAMIVGNDETGNLEVVSHFAKSIAENHVPIQLKHKRVVLLDTDLLVSRNESKATFELEFIKILNEAISAGNIILVIPNFPQFTSSVSRFGADLSSLLDKYLSSKDLQVVALSDVSNFHNIVEKNPIFAQRFETILVKDIDNTNTVKVLENEIVRFENQGLIFTYPAVVAISDGAERYFPDGVMPDKAIDLLLEVIPKLTISGKKVVQKADIENLIETKTGIPLGEVKKDEREKLLNLEEILHKRIVGQDEAILAISNAVRRARSGITSPNRPMGSFLFLGPTGVGKTETTKALADVFFGDKASISRLDMSEYSSFDSVSKLIGSFETGQSGVLSSMLREHPYGVLLLDEFEKTTKEVLNLFLQILDEGIFSDNSGKKVSARNLIIIATSNAGSDMIWEIMKQGGDLNRKKDEIIDSLIKTGIFRPELLNRFDAVVLFHPLNDVHLHKIAEMMLEKLHQRLSEKGINLNINEDLIQFVLSFGTDPKFGARPMNRAIQDKVEEAVAKKIISGSIQKGSPVSLTREELV